MAIRHDTTEPRSSLWNNDHVGGLNDLDDVDAGSPSDGDGIAWDSGASAWKPSPVTGELVMEDGVTAPPVPVENEAQDDWIYVG